MGKACTGNLFGNGWAGGRPLVVVLGPVTNLGTPFQTLGPVEGPAYHNVAGNLQG
jgi:hypothetical protein